MLSHELQGKGAPRFIPLADPSSTSSSLIGYNWAHSFLAPDHAWAQRLAQLKTQRDASRNVAPLLLAFSCFGSASRMLL